MATSSVPTSGVPEFNEPNSMSSKHGIADGKRTQSSVDESLGPSSSLHSPPQTPVKIDTCAENSSITKGNSEIDTLSVNDPGEAPPDDDEPKHRMRWDQYFPEPESETEEFKNMGYSRDFVIDSAANLTTNDLYTVYSKRLDRIEAQRAARKGDEQEPPAPQPSELVKSVVDYVRVLENRIQRLEAAHAGYQKDMKDDLDEKMKDDPEEKLKDGSSNGEAKTGRNEQHDLVLEVRFFHSEGEFDADGDFKNNIGKKGTYTCNTDPRYLIRVLFNWADEVVQEPKTKLPGRNLPNPDDIDILAFGIHSEPVTRFLEKKMDIKTEESHLLKIGKPFRPLLRNLHLLKDQLAKLEDNFGSVDVEARGEPKPTSSVQDSDRQPGQQVDDDLPFPTISDETEAPEAFDTPEALVHFRMLIDFVDKYLGKQASLFERIRAGQEDKIAFQNLWMLFDTGDTIYCPYREEKYIFSDHTSKARYIPQAFRVLGTRGGLPLIETLAPRHAVQDDANMLNRNTFAEMLILGANHFANMSQMPSSQSKKNTFTPLYVVCFNIDFDGARYGTVREIFMFKPFNGLVSIRDLEAYPAHYRQTATVVSGSPSDRVEMDVLVERGRKFVDATKVSHLSYDGLTVGKSREEISSAVMVDFKLAFSEYQDSFPDPDSIVPKFTALAGSWPGMEGRDTYEIFRSTCDDLWCHKDECLIDPYYDFQEDQVDKIEPSLKLLLDEYEPDMLQDNEYLERFKEYMERHDLIRLLPGSVPGFALRSRKWVQLDLGQFIKVEQDNDWNKLVLLPGHREMVQAMVETHARGSQGVRQDSNAHPWEVEMDLVRGKGKGCIILLHGVPGVGKTSTAECVAAYTQRPLYPITCGDIGYVPQEVEANMEKHFTLAHKWGCVLLLDEADVFLAKRNKADVKRNGLVSVFLRILEYYSGILFLTTNRVGAIDDAFRSRLHLTLYYPKLTKKQTKKIWKNNLDRVKTISEERVSQGRLPISYDKDTIMKWVALNWEALEWNGRQIRNAFQTALALAEFNAKHSGSKGKTSSSSSSSPKETILAVDHFLLIAKATTQFSEYLLATHGEDEERRAIRDKLRGAGFEPKIKLKDVPVSSASSSSDDSSDTDSDEETEGESGTDKKGKKEKKKRKRQRQKEKQKAKEKEEKKLKMKKKSSKRKSKSSMDEDNESETE